MTARPRKSRKRASLAGGLTPRARAVLRALHEARRAAPGFVISCGVLPELSESASERLHSIVRDVSGRHLNGERHLRAFRRQVRGLLRSVKASDRMERHLTALIGAETTAAYLFGLSVGLAIHSLPERLLRTR